MTEHPIAILIIDDDDVDRMAVRRLLRASDLSFELTEADHSAAGLAALESATFDCILLDYRLPGTDGLSVLRILRAAQITLPIIVMTGQGDEETAVEIMKAGATDYLPKGRLSAEVLANSVRYALRMHRVETERIRTEEHLRFLAELSQMLVASLDYEFNLTSLAASAVPRFADWCAVDIMQADGQIRRLAVASDETCATLPLDPDQAVPPSALAEVLRSGATAYHPSVQLEALSDLRVLPQAQPGKTVSFLCVPLSVRNRILGAISFVQSTRRQPYDSNDVSFVEEVARRAALAIDNALLYREARDALQVRDAFLSVAAHELKTPLTSLLGYVNLLQRRLNEKLEDRDLRGLSIVADQSRRLNRMVASLLDLSRLQTGQFSIERHSLDMGQLATRVVDEMRPLVDQHSLWLDVPGEPVLVLGDELRLEQVLQNLIQNAIKYSPNGGQITVHLKQHEDQVDVSVEDQGLGIPRDALPRVFWRFYRASNVEPYQVSGMGVGLFVVKEIVELHDGHVSVESTEGVGSTFTFSLPLLAPAQLEIGNMLGQHHGAS